MPVLDGVWGGYQSFEVLKWGVLHTLVLTGVVLVLLCICPSVINDIGGGGQGNSDVDQPHFY